MMRLDLQPLDIPAGARAFVTLRSCSVVDDPYDGVSLCGYSGDSLTHAGESRSRLAAEFRLDSPDSIVMARQTHSCNVAVVDAPSSPGDTDALVTSTPGLIIGVHTADCVPVVMFDPQARIVAAVHSGWRGTVGRIAAATVEVMTRMGARPERIHAAMGPCICADCFEVGEEVASAFSDAGLGHTVVRRYGVRPHVNLPAAVRGTLIEAGLPATGISMPVGCSRCNPRSYFSARRLGVASGRTFTFIVLEKSY